MSFPIVVLDNVAIGYDETLRRTRWRWEKTEMASRRAMAGTMVRGRQAEGEVRLDFLPRWRIRQLLTCRVARKHGRCLCLRPSKVPILCCSHQSS